MKKFEKDVETLRGKEKELVEKEMCDIFSLDK